MNEANPSFFIDHNKILEFSQQEEVNTETALQLFKKFIHFYFWGGGFDIVHDVVDARLGKIRKIEDIPSVEETKFEGIEPRVRNKLKDACIAILDPFDYSYVPSAGFSFKYCFPSRLQRMKKFIEK